MAGGTWDKLEQVFEDRVARALSKLGVYTQNDVQRLAARVDELAAAVNKLVKAAAAARQAPPSRAKRTRARKTAPSPRRRREPRDARGAVTANGASPMRRARYSRLSFSTCLM